MPRAPKVRGAPAITGQRSPEERQVQATAMVVRRLLGDSIQEIATLFRVSPDTVHDRLKLAREVGVLPQAQALILEKLLPLAVAAYAHALVDELGDAELRLKAAKDVLFGTQALQTKTQATVVHEASDSLEAYHKERGRVIEGETIEVSNAEK